MAGTTAAASLLYVIYITSSDLPYFSVSNLTLQASPDHPDADCGARVVFDMAAHFETGEAYGYWLKKVLGVASVYEER